MRVKPVDVHGWGKPTPLKQEIQRQLAEADEEWVDFEELLAEARNLPWYTRAWYWLCRMEPLWWLRYRTTMRYNVVKTGLPPGYLDKDMQMLHACFTLLVDFVEKECCGVSSLERQAKWGGHHGAMATECLALYWWWTVIRPSRGEEEWGMEAVYDARDDEMLARLVKVRSWLWT